MLGTKLHWVDGPWVGRLGLAARPRGGEWLADEMRHWSGSGVDTLVSLLQEFEEHDLGLENEGTEARAEGMRFKSLPIVDREVPDSAGRFTESLDELDRELGAGRNVVLHCRQGVGRTGLVAACLLLLRGFEPEAAISRLSEARGVAVPETAEQRRWIEQFAGTLLAAR